MVCVVAVLVVLAGCGGGGTGFQTSFEGGQGVVAEDVVVEQGFVLESQEQFVVNDSVRVDRNNENVSVSVSNWVSTYRKNGSVSSSNGSEVSVASRVGVVSTSSMEILGGEVNPVLKESTEQRTNRVMGGDASVTVGSSIGEPSVTHVTGETVFLQKFDATILVDGKEVDAYVLTGVFKHDGSVLLPVGVYPKESNHEAAVMELIKNMDVRTDSDE